MKTKYLIILLSLIILILSLSSVSATDSNVDNNTVNDGINNVCLDNDEFISKDSSSLLKEVNSDELNQEQIPILKSNDNSKKGKLKAVINAYYKDRKIPVTVIDKNNKPLESVKVYLKLYDKDGFLKVTDYDKTNSKGKLFFDVSDIGIGKYYAYLSLNEELYDFKVKELNLTIKNKTNLKKARIIAHYYQKNKKVYVKIVDKNDNKPVKNVIVKFICGNEAKGYVKALNSKTNSKGMVYFDVSDLKPDFYYAGILLYDIKYKYVDKELKFTIKKRSKTQYEKITKSYSKNHISNKNNYTKINSTPMENTGIPIIGLLLVLFAVIGISYRKY
ncbi:MAG: hypothetical protein MJ203_04795 [archaeon]|nr:hypothetical protein [archaeon]